MPMTFLSRSTALVFLLISFIMLYGVGERFLGALWMLYKFYGSNGEGISLGVSVTLTTYLVSFGLIAVSRVLFTKSGDKVVLSLSKVTGYIVWSGLILLTILLVTPLAHLYSR